MSKLKKVLVTSGLKCLILTAISTGLRQGELLALTWDDININTMEINVNKTIKRVKIIDTDNSRQTKILIQKPKTESSNRIVPFPSKLIPILKEHNLNQKLEKIKAGDSYEDSNLVFPTSLGKSTDAKNLLIKAGIEHKKFHCLRHTYASKLFEAGTPLKTV